MRNRRLIVMCVIVLILILILFIGNTYSFFAIEESDPNTNVYTTGNLDITYELDSENIKFTNSTPVDEESVNYLQPYRIKIVNSGNVDYKFDIKLEDDTATNVINYRYIMVKVGKNDSISLNSTKDNIIREGIVVKAKSFVNVDVKVYISDRIPNSEIGKNFSARLSINGIAVVYDEGNVDNNDLVSTYESLSNVKIGSYVTFDNCSLDNCRFDNANYENDDNMGYCYNVNSKYLVNGLRVGYIKDGIVYLVSAGGIDCYTSTSDDVTNTLLINELDSKVLKYCDARYIYGGECNNNSIWSFNANDFKNITNVDLSLCGNTFSCGYDNDLINGGGFYWIVSFDDLKQYYWNPLSNSISSTTRLTQNYGIRFVMKLKDNLYVGSGNGTYTDPFVIING